MYGKSFDATRGVLRVRILRSFVVVLRVFLLCVSRAVVVL